MNKKFKVQPLKGVEIHNAKSVGTRTVNLLMGEHEGEYVRGDIMDANAVAQAIDEVRGGIDGSHDSLAKLNEEVKTNATVINGAITYANKIAADLEQETKDRSLEIETLRYDMINRDSEFEDKDELLENKIIIEARDRANADKEINKKIDVINGDSKTDGSIKKAIADVIDAAPEAYDTLKEIADKLKDNDDLHAVIQEAITDKASNEALTNEVNRATAKEEEIAQSVSDLDALAVKGDGVFNPLVVKNKEDINVGRRYAFSVYDNLHDIWELRIAKFKYGQENINDVENVICLSPYGIRRGDNLSVDDNAVFESDIFDSDGKLLESIVSETVALKLDLNDYVKTSVANKTYVPLTNNGYVSGNGSIVMKNTSFSVDHISANVLNVKEIDGSNCYLKARAVNLLLDTNVYNANGGLTDLSSYAKLDENGNINSLIKPAEITSINGDNMAASIDSVNADSVTISDLASVFNKLLAYTKTLESTLRKANLLHYTVVSE